MGPPAKRVQANCLPQVQILLSPPIPIGVTGEHAALWTPKSRFESLVGSATPRGIGVRKQHGTLPKCRSRGSTGMPLVARLTHGLAFVAQLDRAPPYEGGLVQVRVLPRALARP